MNLSRWAAAAAMACCIGAHAQTAVPSSGATIVVPAFGEVTRANDEARATFSIEEQDKDKSAAASRVNQKMKQGTEILKREDPQAKLQTAAITRIPSTRRRRRTCRPRASGASWAGAWGNTWTSPRRASPGFRRPSPRRNA